MKMNKLDLTAYKYRFESATGRLRLCTKYRYNFASIEPE